jgi:hypothetical protein
MMAKLATAYDEIGMATPTTSDDEIEKELMGIIGTLVYEDLDLDIRFSPLQDNIGSPIVLATYVPSGCASCSDKCSCYDCTS